MSTRTTTWKSAGVTHSITSTQAAGQSWDAFVAEHEAVVKKAQALFPPDA